MPSVNVNKIQQIKQKLTTATKIYTHKNKKTKAISIATTTN